MNYTSPITGAFYDYCYTLEIFFGSGSRYFDFRSYDEVRQFRKDRACEGTLYTPDGYPVSEADLLGNA